MVEAIVMSDERRLKEEKLNEFEYGLRPNGSIIGNYRDEEYKIMKYFRNPNAGGQVDLILTGRWSQSLKLKPYYKSAFLFDAPLEQEYNLVGRYRLDILGINQDWFEQRQRDIYRYVLIQDIKKILNA